MEEARARFEKFLQPQENGCINFTGSKTAKGYGQFRFGKTYRSHRFAWLLAGRTIPDGLILRHTCKQNRVCCNVEHLETGTNKENMDDKIRDGTLLKGETHPNSKLTTEQVLEIRSRVGESQRRLAEEFGINEKTISNIILKRIWTHI
jgi:hypothetical protein